jgi:tetratricopeptide (TPR) repeat protein
MNRTKLLKILTTHFDEEELRTFAFVLEVNYEDLGATGRKGKARELVAYLERHSKIDRAIECGKEIRPDIDWDAALGSDKGAALVPRSVLSEWSGRELVSEGHQPLRIADYSPPVPKLFRGRHEELAQLNKEFKENSIVVIGGIAGIGKSYLAAKFAQGLKGTHPVLWLNCEPNVQLEYYLTELAHIYELDFDDSSLLEVLRLPNASKTQRITSAAAAWDQYCCLVVWDGFDLAANQSFLPLLIACSRQLKQGKLLITTREWEDRDDLFNPLRCLPPLSRLNREAGIELMQALGLADVSTGILSQAYERVDGHPKFLTILAGLSRSVPLSDLLDDLPHVPQKACEYLQTRAFDTLEPSSKRLLQELAILRAPFQLSAVAHLTAGDYGAFDALLNRFLITLQSQGSDRYEIHGLVREVAQRQIRDADLPQIHRQLHEYYEALPDKRYLDARESVYHALSAGMLQRAFELADSLLRHALYEGRYDLVLEYTSELLSDTRARKWGIVYHARGRALRFKEQFAEALDAYQGALDFALNEPDKQAAKMEIGSTLTILSRKSGQGDLELARKYYTDLSQSPDPQTRLSALCGLAFLSLTNSPEESISQMKEMLALAQETDLQRNVAELCYGLGKAYASIRSDHERAIEYLERSRSIQEDRETFGGEDPEAWYFLHDALAESYSEVGRQADAVDARKVCVRIDQEVGLERRLAESLHLLGVEQCRLGHYDDGKEALIESLRLAEKRGSQPKGMKRASLEWLTVALWNSGKYEQAIECSMDCANLCEQEGGYPAPQGIVRESDLPPDSDLTSLRQLGRHLLVLPSQYDQSHLEEWYRSIVERRPELAAFSLGVFVKPSDSAITLATKHHKRIGRNEPCPCGSGKKYKHCCMRKSE